MLRKLASAVLGVKESLNAALPALRSRLRHCVPCAVDRGPRPGQSGPGLPSDSRRRFWGLLAPFTPDDDLYGRDWPPRGRWTVTPVELTPARPLRGESPFLHAVWAFTLDDPGALPDIFASPVGEWTVVNLGEPDTP
jgi:hypothetical protein